MTKITLLKTNLKGKISLNISLFLRHSTALDDSHTATSEVVQAIKSVKENIEDCI